MPSSTIHPASTSSPLLWQREPHSIRRGLLWLMGGRLLFGTLLMGGAVLFQLRQQQEKADSTQNFLFWLIGAIYFLTLLYSVLFPQIRQFRKFAAIQLSLDILLVSLLVSSTGCQDSLFLFSYLLVIIGAAFLLYRRGAFIVAAGCLLMLGLVLSGTMFEGVRAMPFMRTSLALKLPELLYILVIHAPAFFLIAFLSSHLVEQLRHTGEILKQQQIDVDNLETLQRDIIQSLRSGLIATNLSGIIQFFNASACELLGRTGEELLGRSLLDLLPELEETWSLPHEVLFYAKKREEFSFLREDGRVRVFGCNFSPLHNRDNQRIGVLLLFQDLTPIKEIEKIAREREKLAYLGGMAAGLAHEIRNPLSSLSSAAQLLAEELTVNEDDRVLLDIVVREADRLNGLLNDFLQFARPKRIKKERHSLPQLLREVLLLFEKEPRCAGIELKTEIPEDCVIEADASLFQQILWNLLLNAVDSMQPDGGQIELAANVTEQGVSLSITDHGQGIPEEERNRIFEPFFSTKPRGTGLGLAVVRRVMADHDGHVELDETFTDGTRFFLFFPSEALYADSDGGLTSKSREELLAQTLSEQREERNRHVADSEETASSTSDKDIGESL